MKSFAVGDAPRRAVAAAYAELLTQSLGHAEAMGRDFRALCTLAAGGRSVASRAFEARAAPALPRRVAVQPKATALAAEDRAHLLRWARTANKAIGVELASDAPLLDLSNYVPYERLDALDDSDALGGALAQYAAAVVKASAARGVALGALGDLINVLTHDAATVEAYQAAALAEADELPTIG
jgi:hypothetical protein